jgi:hypothetical protein
LKWAPKKDPWTPAAYDEDVVYAVSAFAKGKANEVQQRLAWEWLMHVTGEDDLPFRPGPNGDRDTAFASGKQFVGKQLRKMLHPAIQPKSDKKEAPVIARRANRRGK